LQKDRVRTKFRPSKAPHYFYTALPNDSFVSEQPDHDSQDSSASSSPAATPKPRRRLTPAISLTLQNVGSVARDHLASERTFLAYMRTSLALTSAGVGLVQLFTVASAGINSGHRLHMYIQPLGASVVVLGLVVLLIGFSRYFAVQTALTKGYFPVARTVTALMTLALTALTFLTFGVLLAGKLGPHAPP